MIGQMKLDGLIVIKVLPTYDNNMQEDIMPCIMFQAESNHTPLRRAMASIAPTLEEGVSTQFW